VPENLLGLLKLCLLALLYLFFLRVLWAVWSEVRGPKTVRAASGPTTGQQPRVIKAGRAGRRGRGQVTKLVVTEPVARKGMAFDLGPELTLGRAAGCQVALSDDTYASQLHARVFQREGETYVEDLGSTNGTYVNGVRVTAPTPVRKGDSLQVGSTLLEVL
jgi:hypothetical protein